MATFFSGIRGKGAVLREQQEEKSIAFSRYYNDLATRNLHMRAGQHWSVARAVTEGYERVIWVFKSVNTIGTDSAGLPFRLREDGQEVDDHPLYRVLNKKANSMESGMVFRKRLSAQVLLSKPGVFVHRIKSNGGTVKELHLLPPDRTEIIPGINGGIDHFRMTRRDGSYKNFEPDEILWFRDPHPTDPYSGITPLESAGMSVELDHFARLYNVSFMQNDGRPGGVLAVRASDGSISDVGERQMNRIESRFGKGPIEAGKLSVIAGELSYVDLATRPRDMQYGQTSANSKTELLGAFGMSEVVLGNAAGRTFDNADAEMYNYWTRTIPAHNKILLDGFDEDSEDNLVGYFDTSDVEVLERAERKIREEARTEVAGGLRSIKSYADLAGYGDEIEDSVFTRSIYIPNGKTPLPARAADAAALGLDTATPAEGGDGVDTAALGGAATPPLPPGTTGEAPAALADPAGPGEAPDVPEGVDLAALAAAGGTKALGGGARPKGPRYALSLSRKDAAWADDEDGAAAQASLEGELTAILSVLTDRWIDRTLARVNSPQQRKGTRHFVPQYEHDTRVGTKALDSARAVDEETWQQEAEDQVSPIVEIAAIAAAVALLTSMDVTPPLGETLREMATRVTRNVVHNVVGLIGRSAARQARLLAERINYADQTGASLDEIKAEIRKQGTRIKDWAGGVSVQGSTAAISGSRDAAAEEAVVIDDALEVRREWISKRDNDVRTSHRLADRQSRGMQEPFIVGESLLRFPGDPLAPIHETANCRCRLRYRHRRSGRFISLTESLPSVGESA